jgi:hypothetical protein
MPAFKAVFEDSFDHHQMMNTSYQKHTRLDTLTKFGFVNNKNRERCGWFDFGDSFDHHQMTNTCNM